jgi:hypothetical protein
VVLSAITQNPLALEFASPRLQSHLAIVLTALEKDRQAYQFINDQIKQHPDILYVMGL